MKQKKKILTDNFENFVCTILVEHTLKITKPRQAVFKAFYDFYEPVSAQEITKFMKQKINQATVYRIIQIFLKKGILREVHLRHPHADYELACLGDRHHLICLKCGCIEYFEGCESDRLNRLALKHCSHFKFVYEHVIELFGLCKLCAN
jgi:Fe2+ or Zn2+ uptake regulation protein